MMLRRPSIVTRYGFTVLAIALSTLSRFALDPLLDLRAPFILYFPTVLLCAWFGGLWPGVLSTALSGLIAWYVFFPPQYSFAVSDPTAPTQLIIFILGGVLISMLAESLHRAMRKTEESEAKERDQGERLRVTLESIGDAVITTDANGRVTFINHVAERLTGWTQNEAKGKPLTDVFKIINAQTRETVANPVERVIKEGIVVGLANHTRLIASDGTEVPIDDSAAPIRNKDVLIGVVLIFRDISERSFADERFRLAVESAPNAMVMVNKEGRLVLVNSQAEKLFQYSRDELIGQPIEMLVPGRFRSGHPTYRADFAAAPSVRAMGRGRDLFGLKKDGSEVSIEIGLNPIDINGETLILSSILDISERKRAEEERAQLFGREQAARFEAEAANRAKDEFLATISHELRTPLNAILGWARLLRIGQLEERVATKALETIERSAKAQAQLIEDLLDVSRIISGHLRIDFEPLNLVLPIEAALESVRPAAQAKSIQLDADLDSAAGAVMGDASRLQQIIWNLLSNAVKFTPKAGRVEIRLERDDSHAQIKVTDTGSGIRPEFLPYVFERFRQADSSDTRQHGGLGLGLAIVRNLVEMHGGTVSVKSKGENQGATFTVRIPLGAVTAEASKVIKQPAESRMLLDQLPSLDGVRVLVVDDESSAREVISAVLSCCGATVTAVESAAEAMTALAESPPDVLVSDIGMPNENGYELISRIRALGSKVPAVALTAYAKTDDRMRALAAGFNTHVPKPVEPAELALVIASLVERKAGG
jgi:PAS domain S-box-containing protein